MLQFKVTGQQRTLSKHVPFESSFGSYRFKGSADLTKLPEAKTYHPIAARVTVFETDHGTMRYLGKVRVRNFDADNKPTEIVPDVVESSPFKQEDLERVLFEALDQLHLA